MLEDAHDVLDEDTLELRTTTGDGESDEREYELEIGRLRDTTGLRRFCSTGWLERGPGVSARGGGGGAGSIPRDERPPPSRVELTSWARRSY